MSLPDARADWKCCVLTRSSTGPAKYDFSGTRAIAIYDDASSTTSAASARKREDGATVRTVEEDKSEDAGDIEIQAVGVDDAEAIIMTSEGPVNHAELKAVFRRAAWCSLALALIVAVVGGS